MKHACHFLAWPLHVSLKEGLVYKESTSSYTWVYCANQCGWHISLARGLDRADEHDKNRWRKSVSLEIRGHDGGMIQRAESSTPAYELYLFSRNAGWLSTFMKWNGGQETALSAAFRPSKLALLTPDCHQPLVLDLQVTPPPSPHAPPWLSAHFQRRSFMGRITYTYTYECCNVSTRRNETTPSLCPLFPGQFARRHIGPSETDIDAMMKIVGVKSLDDLVDRTVPHSIRLDKVHVDDFLLVRLRCELHSLSLAASRSESLRRTSSSKSTSTTESAGPNVARIIAIFSLRSAGHFSSRSSTSYVRSSCVSKRMIRC